MSWLTKEEQDYREATEAVVFGSTIWQWPEFQAFARRLGLPVERDMGDLTIKIPLKERVQIDLNFYPRQPKNADEPNTVETTNNHNENWKTFDVEKVN